MSLPESARQHLHSAALVQANERDRSKKYNNFLSVQGICLPFGPEMEHGILLFVKRNKHPKKKLFIWQPFT
jgi:hypothetical protein